tara:strand:- start:17688 stop:18635 length:948 start_codon:yes stop_codon:yes gene_type:complete
MKILISRTDKIGDVVLTLPMAGIIKKHFPSSAVYFLGSSYTRHIIERCSHVDHFLNWDEISQSGKLPQVDVIVHVFPNKSVAQLAAKKNIKTRIGTSHRIFHWWTCNRLVSFTRKNSPLHESQLNLKLLTPIKINEEVSLKQIYKYAGWQKSKTSSGKDLLTDKFNLIMHMKSKGSAKEWPLQNYLEVIEQLPPDKVQVFVSGTDEEGSMIKEEYPEIFDFEHVTDTTGKFSLSDFISFIGQCDGLLACSTGPLHMAGISGIKCLGLYPETRPMHPGRWAPIGPQTHWIEESIPSKSSHLNISVDEVVRELKRFL